MSSTLFLFLYSTSSRQNSALLFVTIHLLTLAITLQHILLP